MSIEGVTFFTPSLKSNVFVTVPMILNWVAKTGSAMTKFIIWLKLLAKIQDKNNNGI